MMGRRKQRLPFDAYEINGITWHIAINVDRRNGTPFRNLQFGQAVLDGFVQACVTDGAILHLICLMPDHLHALIEIRKEGLIKVVGRAKSMTTRTWWSSGGSGSLWQPSFYDHGIRELADFEATVTYILDNPVKVEMVEEWEMYPLIGGMLIAE